LPIGFFFFKPNSPKHFNQLNNYLNRDRSRGNFDILVYRKVDNEELAYERCKIFVSNNFIIFLTYNDVFELLEYSQRNAQEEINDFMDEKFLKNNLLNLMHHISLF